MSRRALITGIAPLAVVASLSSALLWGSGYELAPAAQLGYRVGDLRSAFGWAAAVITIVLLGYTVLGGVTAVLKGRVLWQRRRRDMPPVWRLSRPEQLQKQWADHVPTMRHQIDQALVDATVELVRRNSRDWGLASPASAAERARRGPSEADLRRLVERFFDEPWDGEALRLVLPDPAPTKKETTRSSPYVRPRLMDPATSSGPPPLSLPMTSLDISSVEELVEDLLDLAVIERQKTILERADSKLYGHLSPSDDLAREVRELGLEPDDVLGAFDDARGLWSDRRDARRRHDVPPPLPFESLNTAEDVGMVKGAYVLHTDEPTRLGRAVAAPPLRVQERYGLDLGLAWPRLVPLLPDEERSQLERAESATDAAQLQAAGWVVAVVVTVAVAVFVWVAVHGGRIAVPLLITATAIAGVILSRANYTAAVRRTVQYGHQVEAAVDLHRLELLDTLGWRRPRDGDDELYVFRMLSRFLAGEGTSEDLLRPSDATTLASSTTELTATVDALAALPGRLERHIGAGMDRVVEDQIVRLQRSSETVVEQSVGAVDSTIGQALERHLQGPPMVNYDGHVGVILQGPTGPVELGTDRAAAVSPGPYELRVAIGPESLVRGLAPHAEAALRVRNGEKRSVVPFFVGVDSNLSSARRDAVPFDVAQSALQVTEFDIDVPEDAPAECWLWVRVTQNRRTIQNLKLPLAVRGHP